MVLSKGFVVAIVLLGIFAVHSSGSSGPLKDSNGNYIPASTDTSTQGSSPIAIQATINIWMATLRGMVTESRQSHSRKVLTTGHEHSQKATKEPKEITTEVTLNYGTKEKTSLLEHFQEKHASPAPPAPPPPAPKTVTAPCHQSLGLSWLIGTYCKHPNHTISEWEDKKNPTKQYGRL